MSNRPTIEEALASTGADGRLTRGERQALAALVQERDPDASRLARYRAHAFLLARERLHSANDRETLDWLEDTVKLLVPIEPARRAVAEACFGPGEECPRRLAALLRGAHSTLDICVFTITDDRLSSAVREARERGVQVRIITDDEKSEDRGSDIDDLAASGIPVRVDRSEFHMHHKFAIFDGLALVTGSYNWTRTAALRNEENFLVTDDPRLVEAYQECFERLWRRYA
jgi:phosphatidylserine/phosphatidylglycerophosphate/cardiolipin synthase-like enzyme